MLERQRWVRLRQPRAEDFLVPWVLDSRPPVHGEVPLPVRAVLHAVDGHRHLWRPTLSPRGVLFELVHQVVATDRLPAWTERSHRPGEHLTERFVLAARDRFADSGVLEVTF